MFRLQILIIIFILAIPTLAMTKPRKGFHEGPYLRFIGGVISATWDDNARTGEKTANSFEGAYGFQFGWNLWDSAAPELEVRYATKRVRGSREHVVNINLNVKYSFIISALTDIGQLHILPFVKGGPSALLAAVPGDRETGDATLGVWGGGFGGAAGVDFLVYRYVYFGIFAQADVYYIPSVHQIINGTSQKIIAGGWEPQFSVMGAAGVHF